MAATLYKSRTSLSQQIDLDHKVIAKYDATTAASTIAVAQKAVDQFRSALDVIHEKILAVVTSDQDIEDASLAKYQIATTLNIMDGLLLNLATPVITQGQATNPSSSGVRLPKLELPTFDEKYDEWPSFRDLFIATITNHPKLTGAQKLQYLKSSLKGEAERQVKSFAITDLNFQEAWDLVERRYENTREIAFSHIRKIFGAKPVSGDSHQELQRFHDTMMEAIRSLTVLGRKTDEWDDLLVFIITEKLDGETRKEWARELTGTNIPKFFDAMTFIEERIRGLQTLQRSSQGHSQHSGKRVNALTTQDGKCLCCGQGKHPMYKCQGFSKLDVDTRKDFVFKNNLCVSCLTPGHRMADCKSSQTCRQCSDKHNTLLHGAKFQAKGSRGQGQPQGYNAVPPPPIFPAYEQSSAPAQRDTDVLKPAATFHSVNIGRDKDCFLMTAVLLVKTHLGFNHSIRVMLDTGATADVISESAVARLGIQRRKSDPIIYGVGSTTIGRSRGIAPVTLKSRVSEYSFSVNALVMAKVMAPTPDDYLPHTSWKHLSNLVLADPLYFEPGQVDMILGVSTFFDVILGEKVTGPPGTPSALKTRLGWIIGGEVPQPSRRVNFARVHHVSLGDTTEVVRKFWELEEVPFRAQMTADERKAEEGFVNGVSRGKEGRYVTSLPFNSVLSRLGASRDMAMKRLFSLERRLQKLPEYKAPYLNFMREYSSLGHMRLLPPIEAKEHLGVTNYLPHHFVLKEESTTTKFRVVFDGSAPTSTGISLNSTLLIGPKVHRDLFDILLSFRLNPIAIKADITKMFRQFLVRPEDTPKLRILWREEPQQPLQDWELLTVTYGTASAPHTASRCLQQLAEDEEDKFPVGAATLRRDFYVDDLMGSVKSTGKAVQIYEELTGLLSTAKLELRKWDSNSAEVLSSIPIEHQEKNSSIKGDESLARKALGVAWNSKTDSFGFAGLVPRPAGNITKRLVLSEMSRVFDPLGLISPIGITIKIFFQKLWLPVIQDDGEERTLDWDTPIPPSLIGQWEAFLDGLGHLGAIRIPRCLVPLGSSRIELHGFSDTSEQAYAAVIYIRCVTDKDVITQLVSSKTKVAPTRQVSLRRLELCGALLLAKLMAAVTKATELKCQIYGWTDSEIVLRWISSSSRRFSTFVANRVAQIQDTLPSESWRHVRSEDNPADCASRGVTVQELVDHVLWWKGPPWLQEEVIPSFGIKGVSFSAGELEEKPRVNLVQVTSKSKEAKDVNMFYQFTDLTMMIRVTAYQIRFILNCQTEKTKRMSGPLSLKELRWARLRLVKLAQEESFGEELSQLRKEEHVTHSSPLLPLNPFLDELGHLRVGGRLQNASVPEATRHQLILPPHHRFTRLVVEATHRRLLHAGFQLLWGTLRREFWIPRARNLIRTILRCCIPCQRFRAQQTQQLMGSLPKGRVNPSFVFETVGVDFAGPFHVLPRRGRGMKTLKVYLSLFVCFSTKAIHLERVESLTTEDFIATLHRFVSRRGIPRHVHSDNGTNFVGAAAELKELLKLARSDSINHFLTDHNMEWHFIPPDAPHQGGLWEAGVKSAKFHLKRVIGSAHLTMVEFDTFLCRVEAALNSRPLCAMSEDPGDDDVLTPGHFLIQRPLTAIPEGNIREVRQNRLTRWELVTQSFQHFWHRWSSEYLTSLQQRHKWKRATDNVEVGQLVLIREDNFASPLEWRRGRVINIHPGNDGLVRAVTLKTANGELRRPMVKLVPLLLPSP